MRERGAVERRPTSTTERTGCREVAVARSATLSCVCVCPLCTAMYMRPTAAAIPSGRPRRGSSVCAHLAYSTVYCVLSMHLTVLRTGELDNACAPPGSSRRASQDGCAPPLSPSQCRIGPSTHHHPQKRFELVVSPPWRVGPPTPRGLYLLAIPGACKQTFRPPRLALQSSASSRCAHASVRRHESRLSTPVPAQPPNCKVSCPPPA